MSERKIKLQIKDMTKKYDNGDGVEHINLDIYEGEIVTFLGPSGCGKTTILRTIGGFLDVTSGDITIDGQSIIGLPPEKRPTAMVFQSYNLWPHMTIYENLAFGLKLRKVPKAEIDADIKKMLALVSMSGCEKKYPNQMSGGQQQRIAIARSLLLKPSLLLLDEPFSALDAKIRQQMREELKKIQSDLGITVVFVTHDQEEALAISDRIAVMKEGNIMQVGTPEAIYKKPENTFVAGFIGVSNFVECEVDGKNPEAAVLNVKDECSITCKLKKPFTGKGIISARPEQLFFDKENGLPGRIVMSTFLGDFIEYEIELNNGQTLQLNEYTKDVQMVRPDGEQVKVNFDINAVGVYDAATQEVISW